MWNYQPVRTSYKFMDLQNHTVGSRPRCDWISRAAGLLSVVNPRNPPENLRSIGAVNSSRSRSTPIATATPNRDLKLDARGNETTKKPNTPELELPRSVHRNFPGQGIRSCAQDKLNKSGFEGACQGARRQQPSCLACLGSHGFFGLIQLRESQTMNFLFSGG